MIEAHVVHHTRLPLRRLCELNAAMSLGDRETLHEVAKAARECANGLPQTHPMRGRLLARVRDAAGLVLSSYGRSPGPDGAA
ncbi:hypothetical protein F1188_11190 [Roseospira marina]|uniref:Uncharacterized protein n=1 Tax=Roseospira marina TaxID=140057 RepID=A0A5M6ICI0_9PROT|nr:hypothetical protein [Roseospira marina]KAA5605455.1 hypothetical protein F1188_11190 [Roseospira marina]MBB4314545.1 hypothetical protein [Roseospira marina]MBB5088893.1 hypothetical protein [Roseospira marina]